MSQSDALLCHRIVQVTRRKKLAPAAKSRIRTLVRTTGFAFTWKGLRAKAASIN